MIRLLAPSNFLLLKQIIVIIRKKERMLNFYRKKIGDIEPSLPHEKARLEHHFDLVKIVYSNEYTCYDFFCTEMTIPPPISTTVFCFGAHVLLFFSSHF